MIIFLCHKKCWSYFFNFNFFHISIDFSQFSYFFIWPFHIFMLFFVPPFRAWSHFDLEYFPLQKLQHDLRFLFILCIKNRRNRVKKNGFHWKFSFAILCLKIHFFCTESIRNPLWGCLTHELMHFQQLINDFYHKIYPNPSWKISLDVQWVVRFAFTEKVSSVVDGADVASENI